MDMGIFHRVTIHLVKDLLEFTLITSGIVYITCKSLYILSFFCFFNLVDSSELLHTGGLYGGYVVDLAGTIQDLCQPACTTT